jgi:rhodanese-related sulfurtransferase
MNTITVGELGEQLRNGRKLKLLDVRTPAEFSGLHATGAVLIPLDSLNASTAACLRSSDSEPLYVLCHSGARAAKACEQLEAAGPPPGSDWGCRSPGERPASSHWNARSVSSPARWCWLV